MVQAGKERRMISICGFEGICFPIEYSSIAQSVEHAAVNRAVVGSSPTRGAFAYNRVCREAPWSSG